MSMVTIRVPIEYGHNGYGQNTVRVWSQYENDHNEYGHNTV
jgi:hypothetical protein